LGEKFSYVCRSLRSEDEAEVKQIVKNAFGGFLAGEFWDWKYKLNPGFDPSLVMVAEKDGKIIGCNHWLLRSLKLSPSIEAKAVLGADVAVLPSYRGGGVGTCLLRSLRSSRTLEREKPAVAYIFANQSLAARFHSPAGGYVPAPDRTVSYYKILNWKKLADGVKVLNDKIAMGKFVSKLSKFELTVLFKISKTPPLCLTMSEKSVTVEKCMKNSGPDVTIVGDLAAFHRVRTAKKRQRAMFRALLTFKLRIKGKPKKLLVFYRHLWLMQEILSQKIT